MNGLRYTDNDTAEVVQMVLAGKTNKDLVSLVEVCFKKLCFCKLCDLFVCITIRARGQRAGGAVLNIIGLHRSHIVGGHIGLTQLHYFVGFIAVFSYRISNCDI